MRGLHLRESGCRSYAKDKKQGYFFKGHAGRITGGAAISRNGGLNFFKTPYEATHLFAEGF
jgi:hypothetical protein